MTFLDLFNQTGWTLKKWSEYFNIPYRSLQNWKAGSRECPEYLIALMEYKLRNEKVISQTERD